MCFCNKKNDIKKREGEVYLRGLNTYFLLKTISINSEYFIA